MGIGKDVESYNVTSSRAGIEGFAIELASAIYHDATNSF
jgi:hypothetical protein